MIGLYQLSKQQRPGDRKKEKMRKARLSGHCLEKCAGPNGQGEIGTVVHPSQAYMETSMADVIRMQDHKVQMPPRRPPAISSGAKVLLFTGIRYERLDGRDPQPTAPDGRRIKKQ